MPINLTITELTFSDGTKVPIPSRGVIALVGPNNVGKTVALREILRLVERRSPSQVIHDLQLSLSGTPDDLAEWLEKNCIREEDKYGSVSYWRGERKVYSLSANRRALEKCVSTASKGIGDLAEVLCVMLGAEERLRAARSTDAHDTRLEPPKNPIQEMLLRDDVEMELRQEAKRSFGAEFVIERSPGSKIYVVWGADPSRDDNPDRLSSEYFRQLRELPLLDHQGDGLRSFLGTLFFLKLAAECIILIDEPEAFLHPPQAKRLGALISELAKYRQVFIATHSIDFLRGLMDVHPERLAIVHMRRAGLQNTARILQSQALADTWADPMLRYSSILDGLFHDLVILCESEVDCRFYHAALDHLWKTRAPREIPQPSVMFVDVGGKSGFARSSEALKAFGIPVAVIGDFDILNDGESLSRLCSCLDSEWDSIEREWKIVRAAVEDKGGSPPRLDEVRKQFGEACDNNPNRRLDQALSKRLSEIVSYPGPWADAKRIGKSFIPSGQASAALDNLFVKLKSANLHVVPVGEVECWVRDVGGKSMGWLHGVFAEIKNGRNPFSDELLEFVSGVIGKETLMLTDIAGSRDQKVEHLRTSIATPNDLGSTQSTIGQILSKVRSRKWVYPILIAIALVLSVVALLRSLL